VSGAVEALIIEVSTPRMLPPLDAVNRPFWTGGAKGQLLIQRCTACGRWVHPPVERCAVCSGELVPEPVSGNGTVLTFTVNLHAYNPDVPPPYVIAVVVLDEQEDLRLPTNIVECDPEAVCIGMRVCGLFERHGEVFVPVFAPAPVEPRE
jgi:uncharacterized OB-fold protein